MAAKRIRASSRREEILSGTVALVTEVGHQAVRVADVAARLGISPSLVMYHFATKEELVASAFLFAAENDLVAARRVARGEHDPIERIVAIMRWYAPADGSHSWRLWIDGWAASMWNEPLAHIFADLDRQWKQLLTGALMEAIEIGALPARDPWAAAVRIIAFADGLAVAQLARTDAIPTGTVANWIEEFVRAELDPAHSVPVA